MSHFLCIDYCETCSVGCMCILKCIWVSWFQTQCMYIMSKHSLYTNCDSHEFMIVMNSKQQQNRNILRSDITKNR